MHSMITRVQSINFWPPFSWETYTNRKNILLLTMHSSSRQVTRIPNRGCLCKTRGTRNFRAILYRKVWILTKEWDDYFKLKLLIKMHKCWRKGMKRTISGWSENIFFQLRKTFRRNNLQSLIAITSRLF